MSKLDTACIDLKKAYYANKYGTSFLDDLDQLKDNPFWCLDDLGKKYGFTRERARQIFNIFNNKKYGAYKKRKREKVARIMREQGIIR